MKFEQVSKYSMLFNELKTGDFFKFSHFEHVPRICIKTDSEYCYLVLSTGEVHRADQNEFESEIALIDGIFQWHYK